MSSNKFDRYVLIIIGGLLIIIILGYIGTNVTKTLSQELDYKKRKINGIVLKLDSLGRGKYEITIKQSNNSDTLVYNLFMSKIVKENHIGPNDSISKKANTFAATFYKKRGDRYYKCCEY